MREDLRAGDPARLERWIQGARADRQRLLEADLAGGPVSELRVAVPEPARDRRADHARAWRGGYQHRGHGALSGSRHASGAIALWVAGEGSAERAAELVAGLGYSASIVDRGS